MVLETAEKEPAFTERLVKIPVVVEIEESTLKCMGREKVLELIFKELSPIPSFWGLIEIDESRSKIVEKPKKTEIQT